MAETHGDFRPIRFWQRIVAAALAIFAVPLVVALLAVGVHGLAFLTGSVVEHEWGTRITSKPLEDFASWLEFGAATILGAWVGFLVLVPLSHIWRPTLFLRSFLATAALGIAIGAAVAIVPQLVYGVFHGIAANGLVDFIGLVPLFAIFGGAYAATYWLILTRFYARPS